MLNAKRDQNNGTEFVPLCHRPQSSFEKYNGLSSSLHSTNDQLHRAHSSHNILVYRQNQPQHLTSNSANVITGSQLTTDLTSRDNTTADCPGSPDLSEYSDFESSLDSITHLGKAPASHYQLNQPSLCDLPGGVVNKSHSQPAFGVPTRRSYGSLYDAFVAEKPSAPFTKKQAVQRSPLSIKVPISNLDGACESGTTSGSSTPTDLGNALKQKSRSSYCGPCSNCKAEHTPLWRKASPPGVDYWCNACGLFFRSHNKLRDPSLEKRRLKRLSKRSISDKRSAKGEAEEKVVNASSSVDRARASWPMSGPTPSDCVNAQIRASYQSTCAVDGARASQSLQVGSGGPFTLSDSSYTGHANGNGAPSAMQQAGLPSSVFAVNSARNSVSVAFASENTPEFGRSVISGNPPSGACDARLADDGSNAMMKNMNYVSQQFGGMVSAGIVREDSRSQDCNERLVLNVSQQGCLQKYGTSMLGLGNQQQNFYQGVTSGHLIPCSTRQQLGELQASARGHGSLSSYGPSQQLISGAEYDCIIERNTGQDGSSLGFPDHSDNFSSENVPVRQDSLSMWRELKNSVSLLNASASALQHMSTAGDPPQNAYFPQSDGNMRAQACQLDLHEAGPMAKPFSKLACVGGSGSGSELANGRMNIVSAGSRLNQVAGPPNYSNVAYGVNAPSPRWCQNYEQPPNQGVSGTLTDFDLLYKLNNQKLTNGGRSLHGDIRQTSASAMSHNSNTHIWNNANLYMNEGIVERDFANF